METNALTPTIVQGDIQSRMQQSPGVSMGMSGIDAFVSGGLKGLGATVQFPYLDENGNVGATDSFTGFLGFVGDYIKNNPGVAMAASAALLLLAFSGRGRR